MITKKELLKAYADKLITEEKLKEELFKLETAPKNRERKKQMLPKSLTPDEFKSLIMVIPKKDKISIVAFLLAYGSGLRISEIVGQDDQGANNKIPAIKKECFLENNSIKIYGKYSKERIVPLPKGWKDWMLEVLPIKLTDRSLLRRYRKYNTKAGLNPEYTFHSLRASFITRCIETGMPINQVQLLAGHSNLATTSGYALARPESALKSYEDLF